MQPKKVPVWANEETAEPQPPISTEGEPSTESTPGGLSDLEWMKRHMSKAVDVEERVFEQSDNEDAPSTKLTQPVNIHLQ